MNYYPEPEPFVMTSADDAWETLRDGESLLVRGKLESVAFGRKDPRGSRPWGEPSVTISFADWSMAALDCDHPHNLKPIPLSTYVTVRAVRVDDGLKAIAVWTAGGVPIPC